MGFISSLFGGGKKEADPQVSAPAAASTSAEAPEVDKDKDKAKRIGRAALISTSSRGILGPAVSARAQLSAF